MRRFLLVLTFALLFPAIAHAGPTEFAFREDWKNHACIVEQQSGLRQFDPCPGPTVVNNPTECSWDIDDSWIHVGSGTLWRGESASASQCRIVDGKNTIRLIEAAVYSRRADLHVQVDSTIGLFVLQPEDVGKDYRYRLCIRSNTVFGPYTEIPDSNEGFGRQIDYTLSIATPGNADISAVLKNGVGTWSTGCP